MAQVRDSYVDLERHLQKLEEQVDHLIIALDEWRQWKQEYESLRTEVQALPAAASRPALTQTRQAFKGELVNEKELVEIFGRNDSKKRDQIVSVISNRLDYVSKNIDTLAKQLDAAENKLAATRVVAHPDATDEEGLPITDISEQLDDDDNVISYSIRRPGDNQPQILEALKKAGIKDLPTSSESSVSEKAPVVEPPEAPEPSPLATTGKKSSELNATKRPNSQNIPKKKKSVTFSEDTKPSSETGNGEKSDSVRRLEELYRQAREQENIISEPVIPADDSPEDAALREDMIRYNKETMMYEMGPIVAEIQLEEGTDGDDWDDDDDEWDEDDEDQWGRSRSGVVDDEYKRQMLELKERLSKKTFGEAAASDQEEDDDDEFSEGIGRIAVRKENGATAASESVASEATPDAEAKKSVRFASTLDIAENTTPASEPSQPLSPVVEPLSDVIERRPTEPVKAAPVSGKKPSRFRMAKTNEGLATPGPTVVPERPIATPKYAPSGPEGQTIASTILEHEPTSEVKEPDELDANLLHQQVTEEYYKMRNKMISRQGGFLKEDTNPIQPLTEEEGGPKRVSKFKAARLAGL